MFRFAALEPGAAHPAGLPTTRLPRPASGLAVQPRGRGRTGPAGVDALPGPGEMVVSPEAAPRCSPLRTARCCARGWMRPSSGRSRRRACWSPAESAYYLGARPDPPRRATRARIDQFGATAAPTPSARCCIAVGRWSSSWCCCCRSGSSSPPRCASAVSSATGGWPRCGWSAPTGDDPAHRRRGGAVAALLGLAVGALLLPRRPQLRRGSPCCDISVYAADMRRRAGAAAWSCVLVPAAAVP